MQKREHFRWMTQNFLVCTLFWYHCYFLTICSENGKCTKCMSTICYNRIIKYFIIIKLNQETKTFSDDEHIFSWPKDILTRFFTIQLDRQQQQRSEDRTTYATTETKRQFCVNKTRERETQTQTQLLQALILCSAYVVVSKLLTFESIIVMRSAQFREICQR